MKNLFILALAAALVAALYFSKPNEKSFHWYVKNHPEVMTSATGWDLVYAAYKDKTTDQAKAFTDSCTFEDHTLWINVSRNGKLMYTGIASKWFKRDGAPAATTPTPTTSAKPSST